MIGPGAQAETELFPVGAITARRRRGRLRPVALLALAALLVAGLLWARQAQSAGTRTLTVGHFPWYAALVASRHRFFVANSTDGTVSVLDTQADRVLRTVRVGGIPGQNVNALVADQPSGHVFVVTGDNVLTTLDDATGAVVRTRSLAPCLGGLAVDAPTGHLFAGDCLYAKVWMIDTRSGRILAATQVVGQPHELEVDQRTRRVFVAQGVVISVLDAGSGRLLRTVTLGSNLCLFCTPSPPDGPIFVTAGQASTVDMLDATSGRLLRTVQVGMDSEDRTVDQLTGQIVLVGGPPGSGNSAAQFWGPGSLVILDGQTGRVLRRLSMSTMPVAVGEDTRRQHLLLGMAGPITPSDQPTGFASVEVLDRRSLRLLRTVPAGILPWSITVDSSTDQAFLINANIAAIGGNSFLPTHVRVAEDWWHTSVRWLKGVLPWLPIKPGAPPIAPTYGTVTVFDLAHL